MEGSYFADKLLDKGYIERHGESIKFAPVSIKKNEGHALAKFIKDKSISKVLEVGMAWGISNLYIAQQLKLLNKHYQYIVIDPYQSKHYSNIGLENLKNYDLYHNLEFFESPSHSVLPKLLERDEAYDLCFIDGFHTFDSLLIDFYYANLLTDINGFIIFHDMWMPAVRKVVGFIKQNYPYFDLGISSSTGESNKSKNFRLVNKIITPPYLDHSGYKFNFENMCFLQKKDHYSPSHKDFRNF